MKVYEKGHSYYRGFHIRKHGEKVIVANSEDGKEQTFKSHTHAKTWIDKYHKGQHSQHSEVPVEEQDSSAHPVTGCGSIQHSGVTLREEEPEQFVEGGAKNSIAGVLRHFGYVRHLRRRGVFKHKHLSDMFHLTGDKWHHSHDGRHIESDVGHESLLSHLEEHHKDDKEAPANS